MKITKKVILFIIVTVSCCNLSLSLPLFLDILSPSSQDFNQQSRDQDTQPRGDSLQTEERIEQESDATSGVDMSLDSPTTLTHNRTARDVNHPCILNIVREFDQCRNSFVSRVHCKRRHFSCIQAIQKYYYPKCIPVLGYPQATFAGKCDPIPIDCQCAA